MLHNKQQSALFQLYVASMHLCLIIMLNTDTSQGGVRIPILWTRKQTYRVLVTCSRPYSLHMTHAGSEPCLSRLLPCPCRTREVSLAQNFALWLLCLNSESRGSLQVPLAPFAPYCALSPVLFRAAPENPTFGRRTPLPYSGGKLFPTANSLGGGVQAI